jgi:spectinomycin phosphotransferase
MREPPANLTDDVLLASLRDQYGLTAVSLTFLPLGHDSSAWVYQVQVDDHTPYFLKVRTRIANPASLLVPRYLHDHGVTQVIAPLPTRTHTLWATAADFAVILYPFIAGETGMHQGMAPQQWRAYGTAMQQIHETRVTSTLAQQLRHETFVPRGADLVRQLDAHIGESQFDDPAAITLATFWHEHRPEIRMLLERAEKLGYRLAQAPSTGLLCHADAHTGNVLLDRRQQVWIVDWDEALLAPRERDLMFVVGGISAKLVGPAEEAWFFEGYGGTAVDALALAYYRYAWAVSDMADFGAQVFFRPDLGPFTRQEAARYFTGLFAPGEIVAIAFGSGYPSA